MLAWPCFFAYLKRSIRISSLGRSMWKTSRYVTGAISRPKLRSSTPTTKSRNSLRTRTWAGESRGGAEEVGGTRPAVHSFGEDHQGHGREPSETRMHRLMVGLLVVLYSFPSVVGS